MTITKNHLEYLQATLEPITKDDKLKFKYSYLYTQEKFNYGSLIQCSVFFKNVVTILDILISCDEVERFLLVCELNGISCEALNFVICYIWLSPTRWFAYDYRKNLARYGCKEADCWHIVRTLYEKITSEDLPMLTVEDFISLKLYT